MGLALSLQLMDDSSEREVEAGGSIFGALNAPPPATPSLSHHALETPALGLLSWEHSEACKSDHDQASFEQIGAHFRNLRITDDFDAYQSQELRLSELVLQRRRSLFREEAFRKYDVGSPPPVTVPLPSHIPSKEFLSEPLPPEVQQERLAAVLLQLFRGQTVTPEAVRCLPSELLRKTAGLLRTKFALDEERWRLEPSKPKRNEEMFKFVLKKGFRHLFRTFKQSRGFVKGRKLLDEKEFYRHYFLGGSGDSLLAVQGCFLPGSKIQKSFAQGPARLDQNVTLAYLQKVLSFPQFRADFGVFLDKHFLKGFQDALRRKLAEVAAALVAGRSLKTVKLPWTQGEAEAARANFSKSLLQPLLIS